MRRSARVDANQKEIVKALRDMGATVLITSQLKNAFDILVGFNNNLYIVEIKDGEKVKSSRKLTEGEQKCADSFERVGVKYHIVESIDDVIKLIS